LILIILNNSNPPILKKMEILIIRKKKTFKVEKIINLFSLKKLFLKVFLLKEEEKPFPHFSTLFSHFLTKIKQY